MKIRSQYFFLDGSVVNHHLLRNAKLVATPFKKDENQGTFFGEEYYCDISRPWEPRFDNSYPNVIYDPAAGKYRLYYTTFLKDGDSQATPIANRREFGYRPFGREVGLCYAESDDGIEWHKPNLNQVRFDGSTDNNILARKAHGTGVFLDEDDPNPLRRYKMVTKMDFGRHLDYMASAFSADGVHWSQPKPWPEYNPRADTHNYPFRDPETGQYVLITRTWNHGIRVVSKCVSDDFIHWSKPREIARGINASSQIYAMPVFFHKGIYIGLAAVYHDGDKLLPESDTVDVELTYSTGLEHFDFVDFGNPVLPRGKGQYPNSEFDAGCIFAAPPVAIGDKSWCYYMGGNGRHTEFRETSFARAEVMLDRLGGYAVRLKHRGCATVVTNQMFMVGEALELDAEVFSGQIDYRLLDPTTHKVIDGFDFINCNPIKRSGRNALTFGNARLGELGRHVCIELRFSDSKLYSLEGELLLLRKEG